MLRYLREDQRGLASIEFALIAPILLTIIFGVFDISNALMTWRRLSVAASSIVSIATEQAAQTDGSNILTPTQAWQASTAVFATFPGWKSTTASKSFSVTLTSVVYKPTVEGCTSSCSWTANTAWSVPLAQGVANPRACGTISQVANSNAPMLTTLPTGLATASPILVADIATTFTPIFFTFVTGPIAMLQSAYLPARSGKTSQYVHLTAGSVGLCAGY